MTEPWTPDQLAAAGQQVQAPPIPPGPDPDEVAAKAAAASPTETDVHALLTQMQAQQAAMAEEIRRLKAGQAPDGVHPLIGAATSARDLLAVHFDHGGKGNGPEVMRLADDLVDAAGNAVDSGDPAAARQVGQKLDRALMRAHPGGGDHHYFTHALDFIRHAVPDAADTITAPKQTNAPALSSSSGSVPVIQGSVTG